MDKKNKNSDKGFDIFSECLAAMLYSDEEIKDVMSPEDAEEFIRLRNELVPSDDEKSVGIYREEDNDMPMAAETDVPYGE